MNSISLISTLFLLSAPIILGAPPGSFHVTNSGENTTIDKAPHQISLQFFNTHICGGAIISPTWVITAAHCIIPVAILFYEIVGGATNITDARNDPNAQIRLVKRSVVHPKFANNIVNDIALVEVSEAFVFSEFVAPVRTSKVPCIALPPEVNTFTGWGSLSLSGEIKPSEIIHESTVNVITNNECYDKLHPFFGDELYLNENNLCTVGDSTPCIFDEGGPLIQDQRLVGILSQIPSGCGSDTIPAVYTKVGAYVDFIRKYVVDLI